jgi:hypothetical protein
MEGKARGGDERRVSLPRELLASAQSLRQGQNPRQVVSLLHDLGLSYEDIATATGATVRSVRRWGTASDESGSVRYWRKIDDLRAIVALLLESRSLEPSAAVHWLRYRNSDLEDERPLELLSQDDMFPYVRAAAVAFLDPLAEPPPQLPARPETAPAHPAVFDGGGDGDGRRHPDRNRRDRESLIEQIVGAGIRSEPAAQAPHEDRPDDPIEQYLTDILLASDDEGDAVLGDDPGFGLASLAEGRQVLPALEQAICRYEGKLGDHAATVSLRLRVEYCLARAKAHHRAGDSRAGLNWSLTPRFMLERAVGGPAALVGVLGEAGPSVIAELAVAFLGVYAACLRRAPVSTDVRERLVNGGSELVRAYVLHDHDVVQYPRTQALAVQWLYLIIRDQDRHFPGLVDALYELDKRTRPETGRGESTRLLRDAEVARSRGDEVAAQRHVRLARQQLAAACIDRHLRFVREVGNGP